MAAPNVRRGRSVGTRSITGVVPRTLRCAPWKRPETCPANKAHRAKVGDFVEIRREPFEIAAMKCVPWEGRHTPSAEQVAAQQERGERAHEATTGWTTSVTSKLTPALTRTGESTQAARLSSSTARNQGTTRFQLAKFRLTSPRSRSHAKAAQVARHQRRLHVPPHNLLADDRVLGTSRFDPSTGPAPVQPGVQVGQCHRVIRGERQGSDSPSSTRS